MDMNLITPKPSTKHSKGGRNDNVPLALKEGMAVVVWIKPQSFLFESELAVGIVSKKWLKGEFIKTQSKHHFVMIHNKQVEVHIDYSIIIRSTALDDNLKPNKKRARIAAMAAKQRRNVLASVQIVRSEIK